MTIAKRAFCSAGIGALALGSLAGQAHAQTASPVPTAQDDTLQDIVVTAQRRNESAQKVPISMTVLDAAQLSQLQTAADIGKVVPNVQIEMTTGIANTRVGIRGIAQADFNANSTTTNMVYLDDVPMNAAISQGVPIWDLERAEVLRGPQGTLFGRNATGGAIRYIAAMPTKELAGYADFTFGRFGQAEVHAALSGPLTTTLRARVSYVGLRRGGDVYNVTLNERQGAQDYYGVRGILEWQPSASFSAVLRAQYFKSDFQTLIWKTTPGRTTLPAFEPDSNGFTSAAQLQQFYGFQNLGQSSGYTLTESDVRPNEYIRHIPVSLNMDLDLGGVRLTSVTGFLDVRHSSINDTDASQAPILTEYGRNRDRQWTQEVRLTSESNGPFKWIAGAFYLNERVDAKLAFDATAWRGNVSYLFPNASTVMYMRAADQTLETYAGFLHTTYQLTPKLMLTAAARWTHEQKDVTFTFRSQYEFPTAVPRTPQEFPDFIKAIDTGNYGTLLAAAAPSLSGGKSWEELTWKLALDYQLADRTMLFAVMSRGFKGGAFKPTANSPGEVLDASGNLVSVNPEIVTDYEIGLKSDLIPGRLRANAGIFYYDYKDYQTNQLDPGTATQILSNLPKSRLLGAELEINAIPVDKLHLDFGMGYTDTKITKSIDPSLVGNKLPLAEAFNFNGSIRYELETGLGAFSPEISAKYHGTYYTTKENDQKLGDYTTIDARIGFESVNKRIYGALWVKNLTNKVVPIVVDDASEFFGGNSAYINARRTYGLTLGARF